MGQRKLGAIELVPKRKFYDYKAKYNSNSKTKHIIPVKISKSLLKKVLIFSVLIELIGALLIFLFTNFESSDNKIFDSLFHSVSAFNNAGFTISNYFEHSINLKFTT